MLQVVTSGYKVNFFFFRTSARVSSGLLPVSERVQTGQSADGGGPGQDRAADRAHPAPPYRLLRRMQEEQRVSLKFNGSHL